MTITVLQIYNWFKTIVTHLWLSISSVNFYQRVMTSYDGYGMKYVLTLSFVSSLFCSIFILNYVENIRQYFSYGTISTDVVNLDHIISQLPELNYDGSQISLEDPEPVYINSANSVPIAIIDPQNKVSAANRAKVSILLASKKMIVSLVDSQKTNVSSFPIEYWQIFGREKAILTQETIRAKLSDVFSKAPRMVIYVMFPIIGVLIFFNLFLERSFFIIVIYLITNFFMNMPTPIKSCARLVMFTSGVFIILQPVIFLVAPAYGGIIWIIQIWANFLMVLGILKSSNKNFFLGKK
jgi:hypothetical protein